MAERLTVQDTDQTLADRVDWAKSPASRARGILGRGLRAREALIIDGGKQVHTLGLSESIDVIFCDERWMILHVVRRMKPWRLSRWVRNARFVIELPQGAVPDDVGPGHTLLVR
jgi:uncharacterized membrane protein (UPF0127 family)